MGEGTRPRKGVGTDIARIPICLTYLQTTQRDVPIVNNTINVAVYAVLGVTMITTWRLTKPLGTGKRWGIVASQAIAIAAISLANLHQYWVWYYNLHEAERFVRRMSQERGWLGEDPAKRDEIVGLVFTRVTHIGESAMNVQRAIEKVEELGKVEPTRKP